VSILLTAQGAYRLIFALGLQAYRDYRRPTFSIEN